MSYRVFIVNFNPDLHCFVCFDLLFIWRVYKFFFTFADILKDEKSNWNKFDVFSQYGFIGSCVYSASPCAF